VICFFGSEEVIVNLFSKGGAELGNILRKVGLLDGDTQDQIRARHSRCYIQDIRWWLAVMAFGRLADRIGIG